MFLQFYTNVTARHTLMQNLLLGSFMAFGSGLCSSVSNWLIKEGIFD